MQKLLLLAASTILVLSSCASVPTGDPALDVKLKSFPPPPSNAASVYIFRDTAPLGYGAAAAGIAGDMVASGALSPDAEELIIELDNGQVISVTQEPGAERLTRGDLVWVVRGSERTRVIERTE